jgi:hypothetical protein
VGNRRRFWFDVRKLRIGGDAENRTAGTGMHSLSRALDDRSKDGGGADDREIQSEGGGREAMRAKDFLEEIGRAVEHTDVRCDGEPEYRRMVAMLHAVFYQKPGELRQTMLDIFTNELREAHLCPAHWRAVLREVDAVIDAGQVVQ